MSAGPRTPQPRIVRIYLVGSIPFARLLEHTGGGLYLKTETLGVPVASIEAADLMLNQWMSAEPDSRLMSMSIPPPYVGNGYAVVYKAVAVTTVLPLPEAAPV